MYREFDIGTAKTHAQPSGSRAPHHLFDCVEPTDYVTAGEYARRARQVLSEIAARRRLPIVVGGTHCICAPCSMAFFPARSAF